MGGFAMGEGDGGQFVLRLAIAEGEDQFAGAEDGVLDDVVDHQGEASLGGGVALLRSLLPTR